MRFGSVLAQAEWGKGDAAVLQRREGPGVAVTGSAELVDEVRLRGANGVDAEGVAKAAVEKPDLILMDLNLPVIDGWEATRRLKADPATRQIPIIALTAHAMAGDRDKALAAGCDDFDTKPVEFSRLLGKIERALAKTRS